MAKYFSYKVVYHANGLVNEVFCIDREDAQKKASKAMALGHFVMVQAESITTWQAEEFISTNVEEENE